MALTMSMCICAVLALVLKTSTAANLRGQKALTPGVPTQAMLQRIYDDISGQEDTVGKNADYIPALASVPNKMAIAVSTVSGEHMCVGDCEFKVAIESVSKIFTLALVLSQGGEDGDDKLLHQLGNSA